MKLLWNHINYNLIEKSALANIDFIVKEGLAKIINDSNLNTNYTIDDATFNIKWNERHGNALGHLASHIHRSGDRLAIALGDKLCKDLCNKENWNVKGHEDDDVNVMHLALGLASYITLGKDIISNETFTIGIKKLNEILNKSLANSKAEWYCKTTKIHNHCFHNLLLRYICSLTIVFHGSHLVGESGGLQLIGILNNTRKQFHKNLNLLSEIADGISYEGASYSSYSAFSLTIFGVLEYLYYGSSTTFQNKWVSSFPDAIEATYIQSTHLVYNFGDAPYNWSYGPELQLLSISKFTNNARGASFALSLLHTRQVFFEKSELVRNMVFFHAFTYFGAQSANRQNTTIIAGLLELKDNALLRSEKSSVIAFLKGGIHGGLTCQKLKSKNIGHAYPAIGDVAFFDNGNPIIYGALYAKPKKTSLWSTYEFQSPDGTMLGQEGDSIQKDGKLTSNAPNYLDNLTYQKSPIAHNEDENTIVTATKINSYKYLGISIIRFALVTLNNGFGIIDVITKNNESDIVAAKANYVNSYNEVFSLDANNQKPIIANNGLHLLTNEIENSEFKVENELLQAHEFKYKLNRLSRLLPLKSNYTLNIFWISKHVESRIVNCAVSTKLHGCAIDIHLNTPDLKIVINSKEIENEELSVAISH